MSTNGICNYCKKAKKLIDAHIIPKGFLGNVNEQKFLEVSTISPHKKRMRKGPYDQHILCGECDNKIGVYDSYAKSVLIDNIESYRNTKNLLYKIPYLNLDYEKLKKFFISLIWRASISVAKMFNRVSLGPYADIALSQLKGDVPLDDYTFAVLLFKDCTSLKYQNVITFVVTKLAGKKAYKIHFAGYQLTIIPKAKDMRWDITDGTTSPAEVFFKKGRDFYIPVVDQDLSGKDDMLRKIYKRYI